MSFKNAHCPDVENQKLSRISSGRLLQASLLTIYVPD